MTTLISDTKIQQLKESYKLYLIANVENISFEEYIECEAEGDPNFFRWLFDAELEQDFYSSLTEEQIEAYNNFLSSL